MPKTVKGGSSRFVNSHSVFENIKKLKGPFGDFEKFSKKMRISNSLMLPKNLKETLWDFSTFVLLQNIKKIEGRTLWVHERFREKSHKAEKGRQVSVPAK